MKYRGKVLLQVRNTADEWVVVTDTVMITLELPSALSTLPSDQPFDLFYDVEHRGQAEKGGLRMQPRVDGGDSQMGRRSNRGSKSTRYRRISTAIRKPVFLTVLSLGCHRPGTGGSELTSLGLVLFRPTSGKSFDSMHLGALPPGGCQRSRADSFGESNEREQHDGGCAFEKRKATAVATGDRPLRSRKQPKMQPLSNSRAEPFTPPLQPDILLKF
jgi:hypothetical protein